LLGVRQVPGWLLEIPTCETSLVRGGLMLSLGVPNRPAAWKVTAGRCSNGSWPLGRPSIRMRTRDKGSATVVASSIGEQLSLTPNAVDVALPLRSSGCNRRSTRSDVQVSGRARTRYGDWRLLVAASPSRGYVVHGPMVSPCALCAATAL
jgi:hypothetical protein